MQIKVCGRKNHVQNIFLKYPPVLVKYMTVDDELLCHLRYTQKVRHAFVYKK